jgi:glycogen synthase
VAGRSGFVFATFQIGAFLDTWAQALACWAQPVHWEALQRTGMSLALDWDEPAQHYTQIYQQLGHAHG